MGTGPLWARNVSLIREVDSVVWAVCVCEYERSVSVYTCVLLCVCICACVYAVCVHVSLCMWLCMHVSFVCVPVHVQYVCVCRYVPVCMCVTA